MHELVLRARRGDLEAFGELVQAFQGRIFRVIFHVIECDRATAEDLCQEVFLRVHRALPSFDGSMRFPAWIHTIATNLAITEYRRRRAQKRRHPTTSLDAIGSDGRSLEPAGREPSPVTHAEHSEFAARVRACVRELPEEFREAVVLRDLEQLSYEEIGTILGLPAGTVRSRIHRGRCLLQQQLGEFLA
jgi:RNA polymerase sigma-70 factor (ECF subfamily)